MRRYNIVPLILLILFIINFALAAPVLIPEEKKVYIDVGHVPKDVITVLGKRGDELNKWAKLFDNFDRWWGDSEDWEHPEYPGSPSAVHPPSSSAPLESGQGSTQVHVPPANPASSTESDRDPESLVSHPSTSSTASSSESDSEHQSIPSSEPVSDPDRETVGVDHGAPPPDPVIESEHRDAPPSGPGSDPNSA
jgi:hypothetical protein